MLSVEGLPDWRSHLEGGIAEVAQVFHSSALLSEMNNEAEVEDST